MKPGKARSSVTLVAVGAVVLLAPLWMALAAAGVIIFFAAIAAIGAWRKVTGRPGPRRLLGVPAHRPPLPPPGHPDWETSLSDGELAAFKRIEAGLAGREDAGLGILGDETGGAR